MTVKDDVVLELDNDVDGDGNTETGVFQIKTNIEAETNLRTSHLLDSALSKAIGAFQNIIGNDESTKRSGLTIDVGGGTFPHNIEFTIKSGGTHTWGDGGGAETDATGDSARRKKEVIERYLKTGEYGSANPARLKYGEYHSGGVYENYIPVMIDTTRFIINSETEDMLEGKLGLVEILEVQIGAESSSASNRSGY